MTNTRVEYMYRDASNYKQYDHVVFVGEITAEQQKTIQEALWAFDSFLPVQVGLETLYQRWPSHYDDDGPWHTINDIEVVPAPATTTETIAEFAARFANITWDFDAAMVAFRSWVENTPQGPIGEDNFDDHE